MKTASILGVLCLAFCACAPNPILNSNLGSAPNQAADYLGQLARQNHYPAFACSVVTEKSLLFSGEIGKDQGESGNAVNPRTAFYAYSTTKILTVVAILQLVEDGLISLDSQLADYLPYLPWRVTLRQVLSHSAGSPDPEIGTHYIHFPERHAAFDSDALMRSVISANPKLLFTPGTSVSYSSLGYALMGLMIEKVTGTSYADYIAQRLFAPLGIDSSQAAFDPTELGGLAGSFISASLLSRVAIAIAIPDNTFEDSPPWVALRREYFFDFPAHGGVIISNAAFSRIMQAILSHDPALLAEASWKEMFSPQAQSTDTRYALGWKILISAGHDYFQQDGGALGVLTRISVYPTQGLASVYLSNLMDSPRLANDDQPTLDRLFLSASP